MELKSPKLEQAKEPKLEWREYSLDALRYEIGEIERVVETVLGISRTDPTFQTTVQAISEKVFYGKLNDLSDTDWARLENTDSWSELSVGDFEKLDELVKIHGQTMDHIMQTITAGKKLAAPIIFRHDGKLHLVSGNKRLMLARVYDNRPKAIFIEE
jgi:hypothetical protein